MIGIAQNGSVMRVFSKKLDTPLGEIFVVSDEQHLLSLDFIDQRPMPAAQEEFSNPKTIPQEFLLWFHHLPWDHKMESGNVLWDEMVYKYYEGVDQVREMQRIWDQMEPFVDVERFNHVKTFLVIQEKEAVWWRDACVLYFQTFSKRPIPAGLEEPEDSLEYYMSINPRYVPGI